MDLMVTVFCSSCKDDFTVSKDDVVKLADEFYVVAHHCGCVIKLNDNQLNNLELLYCADYYK